MAVLIGTGCEKEVSVTPEFSLPPMGNLFVSTVPDSAEIYINGKNTGYYTPDTIRFLEAGTYTVTLKKNYFKEIEKTIQIIPDSTINYILDYHNIIDINGEVSVISIPNGAEIFIDNQPTGKFAPATIFGVFPGSHYVKLKYPGYWDDSSKVIVKSNFTSYLEIALSDSLTWVNFNDSNSGLPSLYLNHIEIDHSGTKWIGTAGSGLVSFNDKEWKNYNNSNSPLPDNTVLSIAINDLNEIWIGTLGGLANFDGSAWTVYNSSNSGLPLDLIKTLAVDQNGDLWIGTSGGGIVRFDGVNWNVFNSDNSPLPSDFINDIFIDEYNILWIATMGNGIVKFDGLTWILFELFPAGISNNISAISSNNNGVMWAGMSGNLSSVGGSALLESNVWQIYPGLPSSNVLCLTTDAQNNFWFGNELTGVSKYSNGNWTELNTSNSGLPNDKIFSIAVDQSGNKWFATFGGGLSKYKGN